MREAALSELLSPNRNLADILLGLFKMDLVLDGILYLLALYTVIFNPDIMYVFFVSHLFQPLDCSHVEALP